MGFQTRLADKKMQWVIPDDKDALVCSVNYNNS